MTIKEFLRLFTPPMYYIIRDRLYIYNVSSDFYNDECQAYCSPNGTDVTLADRITNGDVAAAAIGEELRLLNNYNKIILIYSFCNCNNLCPNEDRLFPK